MRCCICDKDSWENVDQYRLKEKGMEICNNCGFISYPKMYKTKEEILEYYRNDYRNPPNVFNLYSGQRKLHYHGAFLADEIKRLKEKESPDVLEVGSAFGMFVSFMQTNLPKAKILGTELTTTYKRVAKNEFKIDLADDFSDSDRYDLICTYKVAEHLLDTDKELERYRNCLKDDGLLYIGVPCWFDTMHNFGAGGWDIEYYYSPNHINVWTRKAFESLLKKIGFEIVKQDHEMYDSVYLCKKAEPQKLTHKDYDGKEKIIAHLKAIKAANDLFVKGQYLEAINVWNNFPPAITLDYEVKKKQYNDLGFDWIEENLINKAVSACKASPAILSFAADVFSRYAKLEKAIEVCKMGLSKQPCSPRFLECMGSSLFRLAEAEKDPERQQFLYVQSRNTYEVLKNVSRQSFELAYDWIFRLDAKIEVQNGNTTSSNNGLHSGDKSEGKPS